MTCSDCQMQAKLHHAKGVHDDPTVSRPPSRQHDDSAQDPLQYRMFLSETRCQQL